MLVRIRGGTVAQRVSDPDDKMEIPYTMDVQAVQRTRSDGGRGRPQVIGYSFSTAIQLEDGTWEDGIWYVNIEEQGDCVQILGRDM